MKGKDANYQLMVKTDLSDHASYVQNVSGGNPRFGAPGTNDGGTRRRYL
jgi:hypothetical protein